MDDEPELLFFDQHLDLREPGYGVSFITGENTLDVPLPIRPARPVFGMVNLYALFIGLVMYI